jgi:dTDP-4-amino-4,6-dideoxygalactose transaminase
MTLERLHRTLSRSRAPLFPDGLPLVRPQVGDPAKVASDVEAILASGVLTNGPYVRRFEDATAAYLGVRHSIAVSSCTAGLMLLLRALDVVGDVLLPSFTFSATAHAVTWNGLRPVWVDIEADTLTLSVDAAERAIGVRTSLIVATHVYGTPSRVEDLQAIADHYGVRLVYDAAHAFGSAHRGRRIGGFGDAEVFSLSPTKVVVAGEGGLITTNDDLLAVRCRIGRDYGNPGDYDCRFVGLNARMSELHAATALASLDGLDERLAERNRLAGLYRETFREVDGVSFPALSEGDQSTFKDLTVLIDPDGFGLAADDVSVALADEGVETRRYYSPPVHLQKAYTGVLSDVDLPVTTWASERVLSLPLWVGMTDHDVEGVAQAFRRIRP